MNPSLLQLEHYAFSEISVKQISVSETSKKDGYPSLNSANFGSTVEFDTIDVDEDNEDRIPRFVVRLVVSGEPKDTENPEFPYDFRVQVEGIFQGPGLPEANREALILVNGASLLYGAVREQLLNITARFHSHALMLPTVKFDKLGVEYLERKATPPGV